MVVVIAIALGALLVYFARNVDRAAGLAAHRPARSAARSATSSTASRDGAVTDFLKLPPWPAFNVADIAITFGVLALLVIVVETRDAIRRRA